MLLFSLTCAEDRAEDGASQNRQVGDGRLGLQKEEGEGREFGIHQVCVK